MKKLLFSLLFSTIYGLTAHSQCFVNPNNVVAFNTGSSAYGVVKEAKTWAAAQACAVQFNGKLAIIDNQAEQDSIFAILNRSNITNSNTTAPDGGGAAYVWLGGNDLSTEGTWVWDNYSGGTGQFWMGARSGSAVGGLYNNWGNEPDDFQNQDALGFALSSWPFGVAGQWNDVDAGNLLYFIVEYPTSTSVEEIFKMNTVQVQPNPTENKIAINCTNCKKNKQLVRIFNIKGQLVFDERISLLENIDVTNFKTGSYFIQLEEENITLNFQKK